MPQPDLTKYRTTGAWGAGVGANLSAADVDENFWQVVLRLADLEDNPPSAISIADFTVNGTQLTINMTDGSTRGPFTLPAAVFRFSGEWEPGTTYQFMDIFTYTKGSAVDGLYWVIGAEYEAPEDTTEPAVFDPDVENTENGKILQLMMRGAMPQAILPVQNITDSDVVLGDEDAGAYLRLISDDPHSVFIDLEANVPYLQGMTYGVRQIGDGTVTVEAMDSTITIHPPPGFTLALRGPGASATLVCVGPDEWDATGDFQPNPVTGP